MISEVAGKCMDMISALEVLYPHRRPDGMSMADWKQAVDEFVMEVLKADENGLTRYLGVVLAGLREQYECFRGEQAVVDMGLTTFAHLEGDEAIWAS